MKYQILTSNSQFATFKGILVHNSRGIFFNSRQFQSTCAMSYCKALLVPHCLRNYSPRKKFVYFNALIATSQHFEGILVHTGAYWCIPVHTGAYHFSLILQILNYVELLGILVHTSAYWCILVHTPRGIFLNSRQFHSSACAIMSYCKALLVPHCLRNYSQRKRFVYFNSLIATSQHFEGILVHTSA
jgi:hypothetical protein